MAILSGSIKINKEGDCMKQKITRSRTDSKLAGVCGGLAKYLNIDVAIIRALWVISAFLGGPSIGIYIICTIIIPKEKLDVNTRHIHTDHEDSNNDGPTYGYEEINEDEVTQEEEISDDDDHYYSRESYEEDDIEDEGIKYELNKGYMGIGLIGLGGYLAFKAMFPNFSFRFFWPVLLIGLGLLILGRNNDNKEID